MSATGGHYTCDVLTHPGAAAFGLLSQAWYRMDDVNLERVHPDEVVRPLDTIPPPERFQENPVSSMSDLSWMEDRLDGRSGGDPYLLVYMQSTFVP